MYTFQYLTVLFFGYTSVIILTIILEILEFPTSRLEMSAVADIFDRDGDGYIDYYEFVAALHPNKDAYKPVTDADKIEDEVLHIPPLQQQRRALPGYHAQIHAAILFYVLPPWVVVSRFLRTPRCNVNIKVDISSLFLAGDKAGGEV